MGKVHRPIEGLTWHQVCIIREVGRSGLLGCNILHSRRALRGIEGRRTKLLHLDGRGFTLTAEGKRVLSSIYERWPHLDTDRRP